MCIERRWRVKFLILIDRRAEDCPPYLIRVRSVFVGRARHSVRAGSEMLRLVRNKIATENVTMVPKKIHQGNSITGSQLGCVYNLPPNRPAMLFGRPLNIETTMKPRIMATMFPKLSPRRLVNIPHRKTPSSDPYVYPKIPSTIGMIRTFG